MPDRQLCARYNVRIDDVTKLIDTALGGQPVSKLYEGDRRFDIVVKLDRAAVASPQAIGRLPVHTADGLPVPLSQVAKIEVVDGQTMIARENSRRRLSVRCDIVGRDQGGFVSGGPTAIRRARSARRARRLRRRVARDVREPPRAPGRISPAYSRRPSG